MSDLIPDEPDDDGKLAEIPSWIAALLSDLIGVVRAAWKSIQAAMIFVSVYLVALGLGATIRWLSPSVSSEACDRGWLYETGEIVERILVWADIASLVMVLTSELATEAKARWKRFVAE